MLILLWLFFLVVFPRETYGENEYGLSMNDQFVYPRQVILGTWENLIITKAIEHHINSDVFLAIAKCESGLKVDVKNAHSTASGLFQFINSTFESQSKKYNIKGEKNDPYVQTELAAHMIADNGLSHWNASKSCWSGLIE